MSLVNALLFAAPCAAQFGNIFNQFFGDAGQHQQDDQHSDRGQVNNLVENTYVGLECANYLCEDTLKCVDTPQDCPCPFPESQLKCAYPDEKGYVCISQPSNEDGPTCDFVTRAMQGLI